MNTINLSTSFDKFKTDERIKQALLNGIDQELFIGRLYIQQIKLGQQHLVVKELQDQIACGCTDRILKIIGKEAYSLIVY